MYGPGVFQTVAFALVPRVSESVYEPVKSGLYIPHRLLGLQDLSPTGFQSLVF